LGADLSVPLFTTFDIFLMFYSLQLRCAFFALKAQTRQFGCQVHYDY